MMWIGLGRSPSFGWADIVIRLGPALSRMSDAVRRCR